MHNLQYSALMNCANQRSDGDRYIPLRTTVSTTNFHYGLLSDLKRRKNNILERNILCFSEEYHKILEIALGLEDQNASVYRFQKRVSNRYEPRRKHHWPVRPRRRPLIETPSIILDLPGFKPSFNYSLLDWGSEYLAAALNTTVFLWKAGKAKGQKLTTVMPGYCSSLKWSHIGSLLAIGTTCGIVQIWNKMKLSKCFECNHGCIEECVINILAWHPHLNDLVSGCSKGCIGVYEKCQFIEAHESQISALRFSPDGTFLASSGEDCVVRLWQWPNMLPHMEIVAENGDYIRTFAWHPWHTSYLVIAESNHGSITLWNVRQYCSLATNDLGEVKVNSLEFNEISGELVVNIWKQGPPGAQATSGHSFALVLANLNEVVDKIELNAGMVFHIVWDTKGKQLAAVGEDETLRIWDFFGSSSRKKEYYLFKRLLMPLLPPGFTIPPKKRIRLYNGRICHFEDIKSMGVATLTDAYEYNFGYKIR